MNDLGVAVFPSSLEAIEDEVEHAEDEEDVHCAHQHLIGDPLLLGARAALQYMMSTRSK